jgi:hypothetical protein
MGEGQLELDGSELAECPLPATTAVGTLDPGDDGVVEVAPVGPAVPIKDILLEQGVERLHGAIVTGGGHPTHRPGETGCREHGPEGACTELCEFNQGGFKGSRCGGDQLAEPGLCGRSRPR